MACVQMPSSTWSANRNTSAQSASQPTSWCWCRERATGGWTWASACAKTSATSDVPTTSSTSSTRTVRDVARAVCECSTRTLWTWSLATKTSSSTCPFSTPASKVRKQPRSVRPIYHRKHRTRSTTATSLVYTHRRTGPPGCLALNRWAGWFGVQVGRHVKCSSKSNDLLR